MEFIHVNRLKEEQQKVLLLCEEKITQWEKFKEDYGTLQKRLQTLPDALSYDITVPFGCQAFAKGRVVRTNEVMVLLGDNWFAEVSAHQAARITDRRIQQCVQMLEDLQKEKDQLQNWNKYIDEVANTDQDLVEIVEEYDEQQEKQWREQHAENVRDHRRRLARERSYSGGSTSTEEEQLHQRLHSLEEDEEDKEGDSEKPHLRLDCSGSAECASSSSPEGGKHVRWQDLTKQNVNRITFRHSKSNRHHHNHAAPPPEEVAVQSPSDIYRQFDAFLQPSPPKSILKVRAATSPSSDSEDVSLTTPTEEDKEAAFSGEVRECSAPIPIQKKGARPASHFKRNKNRKK